MGHRCEVQEFDLTAHANREELLYFVNVVDSRAIVLAHGKPDSRMWFEDKIRERYPRVKIIQQEPGQTIEV